jgi:peptide/nickel transport system ATP-binding protein
MYAGRIAEIGSVADVIHRPQHPYTRGLMGSIPSIHEERERLEQIDGAMPRLNAIPSGCSFHPRCAHRMPRCEQQRPELVVANAAVGDGRSGSMAACWLARAEEAGA